MTHILPETIVAFWSYLQMSGTLQLYIASIALLTVALFYEIWSRSVKLSFLDDMSLRTVEFTHPHLPSLRVIGTIFVGCSALLFGALHLFTDFAFFADPVRWIALGAFFIVAATAGIVGEMRRKGIGAYACACIAGTAIAFLFLAFRDSLLSRDHPLIPAALLVALLFAITLTSRMFMRRSVRRVRTVVALTFVLWLPLAFLR